MKQGLAGLVMAFGGFLSGCVTSRDYFKTFERVTNLNYRRTPGYIQSPFDTIKNGGDCLEKSSLLLYEWGRRGIINGRIKGGKIRPDSKEKHAWCEVPYGGEQIVFDPTLGICLPREVLDKVNAYIEDGLDLDFFELIEVLHENILSR